MQGICFIGAGKMATAIATGLVRKKMPYTLHAYDSNPRAAEAFTETTGGIIYDSPSAAIQDAEIILLAVKPQHLVEAVAAFRAQIGNRLIVSIVAGVSIASLQQITGSGRIVRVMPNTPALVGEGMSCIASAPHVSEEDVKTVAELLSSVGLCRQVAESQLDAVTGLSGSGPAFVLEFIMALADGGVYAGLPRDAALDLAIQTVLGSAKLAREAKNPIGDLRDAVISPAGTTGRGCLELAKGAFSATVAQAVIKAAERSAELGALTAKK